MIVNPYNDLWRLFSAGMMMLSLASLWVRPPGPLFWALTALTVLMCTISGFLALPGLAALSVLVFALGYLARNPGGWKLRTVQIVVFLWGLGSVLHLLPGFRNWLLMQDAILASGSVPARFWINMDKGLTGLMILGLGGLPLMRTWVEWKTTLRKIWAPVLLGVAVFAAVGTGTGFVRFDPQLKPLWLLWLATHLFFVAICEEVFWRGFVQKTLETVWQNQTWGRFLALGLTSLVFGLTHTGHPLFQTLACGAGLFYGALFQKTGRLESAVIPHFLLNATHFLLFTWPAAAPA